MRGVRRVNRVQSGGTGLIGRNGVVHTPRGVVRSSDEARRLGVLPFYVIAQQIVAQRDLVMEG
jgi:hypothetical protein